MTLVPNNQHHGNRGRGNETRHDDEEERYNAWARDRVKTFIERLQTDTIAREKAEHDENLNILMDVRSDVPRRQGRPKTGENSDLKQILDTLTYEPLVGTHKRSQDIERQSQLMERKSQKAEGPDLDLNREHQQWEKKWQMRDSIDVWRESMDRQICLISYEIIKKCSRIDQHMDKTSEQMSQIRAKMGIYMTEILADVMRGNAEDESEGEGEDDFDDKDEHDTIAVEEDESEQEADDGTWEELREDGAEGEANDEASEKSEGEPDEEPHEEIDEMPQQAYPKFVLGPNDQVPRYDGLDGLREQYARKILEQFWEKDHGHEDEGS